MDKSSALWMASPITTPDNKTMVTVTADGSTDQFEFNFPGGYIARSHIKGYMLVPETGARTDLALTFIRDNLVRVSPFPPAGNRVTIFRDTPKEVPTVSFIDGAMIEARNLDANAKQCIFAVAEMLDRYQVVYDQVELAELYAKAAANSAGQAQANAAFVEEIYNRFKLTDELMAEMRELARQSAESAVAARDSADQAKGAAGATTGASRLYATVAEAQTALNEGHLTEGEFFFVVSPNDTEISILHRIVNGLVTVYLDSLGRQKSIPAKLAIDQYLTIVLARILTEEVPTDLAAVDSSFLAGVSFADGSFAPYMRDTGRVISVNEGGEVLDVGFDRDFSEKFVATMGATTLPDGKQISRVMLNDFDEIVQAWTTDGSYYVASDTGLIPVSGSGGGVEPKPPATQATYAGGIVWDLMNWGTTRVSVEITPKKRMYIMGTFGQSLAEAYSQYAEDTLVATTKKFPQNAWMFKSSNAAGSKSPRRQAVPIDDFESLEDSVVGGFKETVGSSFTAHLIDQLDKATGQKIEILHFVAAVGGKPWRDLMKGSPAWSYLEQGLIDAKRVCEAKGYEPVVLGFDVKAGESDTDQTGSMAPLVYEQYLKRMDVEMNGLVRKVFGPEHGPVRLFVEQCSFQPHAANDGRVRFGQLAAHGKGNIIFTGASYQYDHTGDVIHINSKGQNSRGVQLARAVAFECFGVGFQPPVLRQIYWKSPTLIEMAFSGQGAFMKDTSGAIVSPDGLGEGAGFRVTSRVDGSTIPILGASVVSGSIQLVLDNPNNVRDVLVTYASFRTITGAGSGPIVGARGLFRYTNGTTNLYTGKPEYIWLPAFYAELS